MSTISPYTGDGSTKQFDITFDYEDAETVKVRVDGVDQVYTFVNASRVELSSAPQAGTLVEVYRETDVSEADVVYQDGAIIRGADLNASITQVRHRAEELGSELESLEGRAVLLTELEDAFGDLGLLTVTTVSGTAFYASRASMRAVAAVNGQGAILTEGGRSGPWVFSTANLSAQVTADPNQGIYLAPDSDTTGASGAWVRQFSGGAKASWFGFSLTMSAINQALVTCSALGITALTLDQGTHFVTGALQPQNNVHLEATGATLDGSGIYIFAAAGAGKDNWSINGLTIETDGAVNYGVRLFACTNFKLTNCEINRNTTGGYIGMLIGGSGGEVSNFKSTGSNGWWIEGSHSFKHGRMIAGSEGGDDCLVVKASYISVGDPRTSSEGITIHDWYAEGYAAAVSIGSEIGYYNANDPTFSRRAANITVSEIAAKNCSYAVFIKPGANSTNSYRDGTVENVSLRQIVAEDLSGARMKAPIHIEAGRGGRVRQVEIDGVLVRGRFFDQASVNAVVLILPYDYTGGTAASSISDVFIRNVKYVDPHGGAPNGAGVPGYPLDFGVYIERQLGSGGTAPTVGYIEFENLQIDGTRRNAVLLGSGLTGPIVFRGRTRFKNIVHTGAGAIDRSAFSLASPVTIEGELFVSFSPSAPADTRPLISDNAEDKSVRVHHKVERIDLGDVAATTTVYRSFSRARDAYISRIELVARQAVAADATNKVTVTVDNKHTAANLTTKDTNTGFALAASTPVSIAGANQFTGANSLLPKGKVLDLIVATAGTATLQGAALLIHYSEYGEP